MRALEARSAGRKSGAKMVDCRRVQAPGRVDGPLPQAPGLGGKPDSAETAATTRRQELAAGVESRLQVRRRDLRGPFGVCESPGVQQKHTHGSRQHPSFRARPSQHHEPHDQPGKKEHDPKGTQHDSSTDVGGSSPPPAHSLRAHPVDPTRPDGRNRSLPLSVPHVELPPPPAAQQNQHQEGQVEPAVGPAVGPPAAPRDPEDPKQVKLTMAPRPHL